MRIPRDIDAKDLIKLLARFGYVPIRQTGTHFRLTTTQNGEHHITIPNHSPLRIGTLSSILSEVVQHLGISKEELLAAK